MKKTLLLILALLSLFIAPHGAVCDAQIRREGPANESIGDVLALPEGGFLLIGYTTDGLIGSGEEAYHPLARKIDDVGNVLWETDIAGEREYDTFARAEVLEDGRIRLCRMIMEGSITETRITTLLPGGTLETETVAPAWVIDVAFVGERIYMFGMREELGPKADDAGARFIYRVGCMDASGNVLFSHDLQIAAMDTDEIPPHVGIIPLLFGVEPAEDGMLLYGNCAFRSDGENGFLLKIGENGETAFSYRSSGKDHITSVRVLPDGSIFGVGYRLLQGRGNGINFVFHLDKGGRLRFEESLEVERGATLHGIFPAEDGYWVLGAVPEVYPIRPENPPDTYRNIPLLARLDARGALLSSGRLEGEYAGYSFVSGQSGDPLLLGYTGTGIELGKWGILRLETLLSGLSFGK